MIKFGTSGLRGLATELLDGVGAIHAAGFAAFLLENDYIREGDAIYVGRDNRESSPELASQCCLVLQSYGLKPIDCGTVPTPALALYAMDHRAPCLMVTGSHIPADRNGLKFYRPDGEIDKNDEAKILQAVANLGAQKLDFASSYHAEKVDVMGHYIDRHAALFPRDVLSGKRIGIYEHSSVAAKLLHQMMSHYGAETVSLAPSDFFIPIDTEAVTEATRKDLKYWAKEHRLDAILSTDGDADRPFMADETGTQIYGDMIGTITAKMLGVRNVVTPVTSNARLDDTSLGLNVSRTKVGSPFVISTMEETADPVIGFEANGGVMLGSNMTFGGQTLTKFATRDAMLPILCVLAHSVQENKPLTACVKALQFRQSITGRIEDFAVERSAALMHWLREDTLNAAKFMEGLGDVERVSDIDGIQIFLTSNAMIHVRPSGNAPEMRCYATAETMGEAKALMEEGLKRIQTHTPAHV